MVELIVLALCSIVALSTVGMVLVFYYLVRTNQIKFQPPAPRYHRSRPARFNRHHNQVQELQIRLFGMVSGDQALAHRLVDGARRGSPGQHETWYWEKAIQDLIRDRR